MLIECTSQLDSVLRAVTDSPRVAVDVESNGMFAYQQRVCTVQLAWRAPDGSTTIALVDALAVPVRELEPLLGDGRVVKVLHDLSFDARVLHLEGTDLCNVRDTAIAAGYLGRSATGLASLLASELGVLVSKEMQNTNWAIRPLSTESLDYLANDVRHLLELDTLLLTEAAMRGIDEEVATETAFRLHEALQTQVDTRPAFARVRGVSQLDELGKRVLKELCDLREAIARERDLPPQRIINDQLVLALASRRPAGHGDMARVGPLARRLRPHLWQMALEAVRRGLGAMPLTDEEQGWVQHGLVDRTMLEAKRSVEKRLQSWRRAEAARRGVDEQVVLPTHCIRLLATGEYPTPEHVDALPGFGHSRARRYAELIAQMLSSGDD
jgi:ribonuclease D